MPEFIGSSSQIEQINGIAQEVYGKFAEAHGIDPSLVSQGIFCFSVSFHISRRLLGEGYNAQFLFTTNDQGEKIHYMVGVDGHIVDGTWKQFVDCPSDDEPNVLVAQRDQLSKVLISLGVHRSIHWYWTNAQPD